MSDAFRRGIRPPTRLAPWAWAAVNVKIQNSERSSVFDPEQTPWWKGPMECAADVETRNVVVLAPTGSGKSTMAEALIPYVVSEDPGPMLYASQTDEDAKFWAESRLIPALKSCAALTALWPEDRHKSRKLEILFPHMPLVMGGANLSNFQEKSVRWLYGDEVWTWRPGLVREFLARHHDRWNRKVFLVSQGGYVDSEFDLEWRKTDQASFGWRCQKCEAQQVYSFDSIKFERIEIEGELDEQATADTAQMECIECQTRYGDTAQNRRALASSNVGNGNLGYIATHAGAIRGYRGFHVDSLAVWWIPWANEVVSFLEADRLMRAGAMEKFRQWKQKRRAAFWSEEMVDAAEPLVVSGYSRDEVHAGATIEREAMRFATIDVGGDHFWLVIRAWCHGGASTLLWEGYVPGRGGDETELNELIERFGVEPNKTFIDIGYDEPRILNLIVRRGWVGIKGDGKKTGWSAESKSGRKVENPFSKIQRKAASRGGIARWVWVATNPIKDMLARLSSGHGAEWRVFSDVSNAYRKHFKAERMEEFQVGREQQVTRVWVQKSRNNHLFDCEVYQVGAARMFRLFEGGED
jgi:phage terminase large subunit GpA-like protein